MKLEKLNLTELDVQELQTIDGGWWKEVVMYLVEKAVEYGIENPEKMAGVNAHTYKLGHVGGGRP